MNIPAEVPTLFHIKGHCSSMPYNVALELGLTSSELKIYDLEDNKKLKGSEYSKVSHRGVVPTMLMPDGSVICEVGAIVLYLLETHDKKGLLHPLPGSPTRAKFLQAVVYTVAECFQTAMELFHACFMIPEEKRDAEKVKNGKERVKKVIFDHLKIELDDGKKEFYLGEFSAADIMMAYILMSVEFCKVGVLEDEPVVKKYFERLAEREIYKKLFTMDEADKKALEGY